MMEFRARPSRPYRSSRLRRSRASGYDHSGAGSSGMKTPPCTASTASGFLVQALFI